MKINHFPLSSDSRDTAMTIKAERSSRNLALVFFSPFPTVSAPLARGCCGSRSRFQACRAARSLSVSAPRLVDVSRGIARGPATARPRRGAARRRGGCHRCPIPERSESWTCGHGMRTNSFFRPRAGLFSPLPAAGEARGIGVPMYAPPT